MRFQLEFEKLDHDEFLLEPDVDKKVEILARNVVKVLDDIAPLRTITIKQTHAKYLTPDLIQDLKRRDELREAAVRSKLEAAWRSFKVFRNDLRRRLKVAKKNYLSEKILTSNSKEMWQILKESSGLQV